MGASLFQRVQRWRKDRRFRMAVHLHLLDRLTRQMVMIDALNEELAEARERVANSDQIITKIRWTLGRVSTLDGIDGPVALLVAELARDHDELEARIEAVLTEPTLDYGSVKVLDASRVHHLLRGGTRVPDYPPDHG